MTTNQIADRLPIDRQSVYERLTRLDDEGDIESMKLGTMRVWHLPNEQPQPVSDGGGLVNYAREAWKEVTSSVLFTGCFFFVGLTGLGILLAAGAMALWILAAVEILPLVVPAFFAGGAIASFVLGFFCLLFTVGYARLPEASRTTEVYG